MSLQSDLSNALDTLLGEMNRVAIKDPGNPWVKRGESLLSLGQQLESALRAGSEISANLWAQIQAAGRSVAGGASAVLDQVKQWTGLGNPLVAPAIAVGTLLALIGVVVYQLRKLFTGSDQAAMEALAALPAETRTQALQLLSERDKNSKLYLAGGVGVFALFGILLMSGGRRR